jgi:hypothetical protein
VLDGREERDFYFDSLPAAYYVMHERYRDPQYLDFEVQVYDGLRINGYVSSGSRLLDARNAYYVWDYERFSRGGLPLILAFSSREQAQDELRYRRGRLLDYIALGAALDGWKIDLRRNDRVYWRGEDPDRWGNDYYSPRWQRAWEQRWAGFSFDIGEGWLNVGLADTSAKPPRGVSNKPPGPGWAAGKPGKSKAQGHDKPAKVKGKRDKDKPKPGKPKKPGHKKPGHKKPGKDK